MASGRATMSATPTVAPRPPDAAGLLALRSRAELAADNAWCAAADTATTDPARRDDNGTVLVVNPTQLEPVAIFLHNNVFQDMAALSPTKEHGMSTQQATPFASYGAGLLFASYLFGLLTMFLWDRRDAVLHLALVAEAGTKAETRHRESRRSTQSDTPHALATPRQEGLATPHGSSGTDGHGTVSSSKRHCNLCCYSWHTQVPARSPPPKFVIVTLTRRTGAPIIADRGEECAWGLELDAQTMVLTGCCPQSLAANSEALKPCIGSVGEQTVYSAQDAAASAMGQLQVRLCFRCGVPPTL
eukprot:gene13448-20982_t